MDFERYRAVPQPDLVRMSMVMPMAVRSAGHLFDRHHASFEFAASLMLELDGGVRNLEMCLQHMVQVRQNAGAL